MTKATKTRGTVLLRVALVFLCLAVFYWGLHYKMSLYHAGPALQQSPPAKLWTGDQTSTGFEHAMREYPTRLQLWNSQAWLRLCCFPSSSHS